MASPTRSTLPSVGDSLHTCCHPLILLSRADCPPQAPAPGDLGQEKNQPIAILLACRGSN